MANANSPRGLIPWRMATNAYETGGLGLYYVPAAYATNIFVGDPVIATGACDAYGVPVVALATAGATNYLLGSMVGIAPGGPNNAVLAVTRDMAPYHLGTLSQYILVAHDPNQLFWVQEDSDGGFIATATAGTKNINLVAGAGSTTTGYSGWMIDSSGIGTGATLQMRIMQALVEEDNQVGANYAKWLVRVNLHSLTNTTGI